MNLNACRVVWVAILCCAACGYGHAATVAESKTTLTKSEIPAEPPGLALAAKAALEWWQLRAAAFPEFQVSSPKSNWRVMTDPLAKDPKAITYTVLSEDGQDAWFAMTHSDRPNYWEVSMPTHANCTVVYSVAVDPPKEQTRVWEVRFVYPVSL